MAKGQQRGTREKKKPKQTKPKGAAPGSTFATPPGKVADTLVGKKKW